jgi:predicted AAA+ superfamily ATPase
VDVEAVGDHDVTLREDGKAHDVLILGPQLTGKSTATAALLAKLPYPAIRLDAVIEQVGMGVVFGFCGQW